MLDDQICTQIEDPPFCQACATARERNICARITVKRWERWTTLYPGLTVEATHSFVGHARTREALGLLLQNDDIVNKTLVLKMRTSCSLSGLRGIRRPLLVALKRDKSQEEYKLGQIPLVVKEEIYINLYNR